LSLPRFRHVKNAASASGKRAGTIMRNKETIHGADCNIQRGVGVGAARHGGRRGGDTARCVAALYSILAFFQWSYWIQLNMISLTRKYTQIFTSMAKSFEMINDAWPIAIHAVGSYIPLW
jgi:hypothetical protein